MKRKLFWGVLAIGLALVIAPFALGLPGKSAAGQRMLNNFQPIMQPDQVQTAANYYDHVFVPLGKNTLQFDNMVLHNGTVLQCGNGCIGVYFDTKD